MTSLTKASAVSILLLSIFVAAVIYIETSTDSSSFMSSFVTKTKTSLSLQSLIDSKGDELEVHRQLEADVILEPNVHDDGQKRHRSEEESLIRLDRLGKVRGSMVDPQQTEVTEVANRPRVRRMVKLKTFEY